jgi:hypothetical protein
MARARPAVRRGPRQRGRIDPRREMAVHVLTDGPSKGWVHTHGLAAHGMPELEMRNVPLFLGAAATGLLNDLAEYLLNDLAKPFVAGDLVHWDRSRIQVLEACADEDAGYDPDHYRTKRLVLADPPDDGCACDECARELAGRPPLAS